MKHVLGLLTCLFLASANAATTYDCKNPKIDEDATYYKQQYSVLLNAAKKTAAVTDSDSTLDVTLSKLTTASRRFAGGLSGTLWCDGGCCVNVVFDAAMVRGESQGSMQVDQELECQDRPARLKCVRQ